jgi:hypothetical protein
MKNGMILQSWIDSNAHGVEVEFRGHSIGEESDTVSRRVH